MQWTLRYRPKRRSRALSLFYFEQVLDLSGPMNDACITIRLSGPRCSTGPHVYGGSSCQSSPPVSLIGYCFGPLHLYSQAFSLLRRIPTYLVKLGNRLTGTTVGFLDDTEVSFAEMVHNWRSRLSGFSYSKRPLMERDQTYDDLCSLTTPSSPIQKHTTHVDRHNSRNPHCSIPQTISNLDIPPHDRLRTPASVGNDCRASQEPTIPRSRHPILSTQ